jgi:hypothetical protein
MNAELIILQRLDIRHVSRAIDGFLVALLTSIVTRVVIGDANPIRLHTRAVLNFA